MPIKEYKCENSECENNNLFEYLHRSILEEDLTTCPICGHKVDRKLSSCSAHFKGSGFYCVDYKPKKKEKEKADNNTKSKETK